MRPFSIIGMSYDAAKARRGLQKIMDTHKLSERGIAKLAGRSPATITHFLRGRTDSLTAKTYDKIAEGMTNKFGREFTVAELRGDAPLEIQLPIRSYVGAGDEVVAPVEGDGPIDYVAAPPELAEGEVLEVRGRSMLPAYEHGDLLFHRFMDPDPRNLLGKLVIAKLKDGRRFVKVLQPGSKRGRFTLTSLNPSYAPMEDQAVAAVARIVWVKKKG